MAIGPAINSFMETYHDVENIRESESSGDTTEDAPDSPEIKDQEKPMDKDKDAGGGGGGFNLSPGMLTDEALNKINMNIQGDRVLLSGLLDMRGLRLLEKRIAGLKALLSPLDDADDNDARVILADDESPPLQMI